MTYHAGRRTTTYDCNQPRHVEAREPIKWLQLLATLANNGGHVTRQPIEIELPSFQPMACGLRNMTSHDDTDQGVWSHGIFRCFEYRKVESTIPKWSGPQGWGWNHGPIIGHGSFFLISQIFWRFGFPFFCLFRPLWALYVSLFSLLVGYTKDGLQQNGTLYKGYGTLPHSFNVTCDLTLGEFFQIVINQPIFKK